MTIEKTVLTCFIHEAKKKNYYVHFLKGVKSNNIVLNTMSQNVRRRRADRGESVSLNNCRNLNELEEVLIKLNGDERQPTTTEAKVHIITMTINHLLHFFLEEYLTIEELCKFGQGIFDEAMKRLSIDPAEDKDDINSIQDVPSLLNKMRHDYFVKQENSIKSFEQFIKEQQPFLEDWAKQHPKNGNEEQIMNLFSHNVISSIEEMIMNHENGDAYLIEEDEEEDVENDENDLFQL